MIIQEFNNGWGNEWTLKKFEQRIVDRLLRNIAIDSSRTVVINSVWYSTEYHNEVMSWLRTNSVDRIVLVAMLDGAIPHPAWYSEFNCEILSIGYYPGEWNVDFCALFVENYLNAPDLDVLLDLSQIDTAYMCLNRKPHWHRRKLYDSLKSQDIVKYGIVSMGGLNGTPDQLLEIDLEKSKSDEVDQENHILAPNSEKEHYGPPNDVVSLGHIKNWQRHFVNIVTETIYDINRSGFVSEKIYKPIVGCRPFLVYDPDGGTQWLQDRGFIPYVKDFIDITDLDLTNPNNIAPFLAVLCGQTPEYWQAKYLALQDKILYNKHHFTNYVYSQWKKIKQGIPCQV
jgi:hypothetical protein